MRCKLRLWALLAAALLSLVAFLSCGGAPEAPAGSGQTETETTTSDNPEDEDGGGSRQGNSVGSRDGPSTAGSEVKQAAVGVVDTSFKPLRVSIVVGSEVVWKQTGRQPHSVTSADESFDSSPDCSPLEIAACLTEGTGFSHTFGKPGIYRYYCRVHGLPNGTGMAGTVISRRL